MFRKLLKYDFSAVWRIGAILCAAAIGLSFIGAFAMRFTVSDRYDSLFINISGGLVTGLSIFGISIAFAAVQIIVLYRFYSNLYTDEGYLTFTLPLRRRTLLDAKLVNAFLWQLIMLFSAAVCLSVFMTFAPEPAKGAGFINLIAWKTVFEGLSETFKAIGPWTAVYAAQGLVFMVGLSLSGFSLMYFCITLGAVVVKKHKLLAAIGICYGVTALFSLLVQISLTLLSTSLFEGMAEYISAMSQTGVRALISLVVLGATAAVFTVFALFYLLTLGKMERKLNLP